MTMSACLTELEPPERGAELPGSWRLRTTTSDADHRLEELEFLPTAGQVSTPPVVRLPSDRGRSCPPLPELRPRPLGDRSQVSGGLDVMGTERLVRAGSPVLEQLSQDLAPTRIRVVLADDPDEVLERHSGTTSVSAPISDPCTGRVLGVLALVCSAEDANELMLPLAIRAAREIEARLADDTRVVQRAALQQFLRQRRRVRGPLVLLSGSTMLTNAAADRVVEPGDEEVLRDCARRLSGASHKSTDVLLSSGAPIAVDFEPVRDGGVMIGSLLRLRPGSSAASGSGRRRPYGWESLTESEHGVIELVAQGLTNRQVADRLFISPYTVDFHLRSVFRKLAVKSRVELTRLALEHARNQAEATPIPLSEHRRATHQRGRTRSPRLSEARP
jgi:DNA-binding CsgD family transcriptional regulator